MYSERFHKFLSFYFTTVAMVFFTLLLLPQPGTDRSRSGQTQPRRRASFLFDRCRKRKMSVKCVGPVLSSDN